MNFVSKNKLVIIGTVLGSIAGFAYYYYIGCSSGQCAITSKPINSTLYGAMMGGLFFSLFKNEKTNN